MDQNQFETNQFYQAAPVVKNAAYYRACARRALTGKYILAVVAFLLASLLGGIVSGGSSVSFNNTDVGSENGFGSSAIESEVTEFIEIVGTGDIGFIFESYPFLAIALGAAVAGALFGTLLNFFVGSPVALGYQKFNLDLVDGKPCNIGVLFGYFKACYGKSLLLRLLQSLISFACSLPLLIVLVLAIALNVGNFKALFDGDASMNTVMPIVFSMLGLAFVSLLVAILQTVVSFCIYFAPMILAEYPEMSAFDALRNSATLMHGNKWRLFCLHFSFIGWMLLAVCCTCGIGVFFLSPYMYAADAAFYDDIANRAAARGTEFPSVDPNDYDPNQMQF